MRLLHTSDWHLGRSFHGTSTLPQLREVLAAIPEIVRNEQVDAVLVSGDVFDHAAPAAELYGVLAESIRGIREAGATVVMISGNHDNAARLGFQSEWAALGGVHVLTRADAFRSPLTLHDADGPVDIYAIPYLEPMLQRSLYPGERLNTHADLLGRVMADIAELRDARGHRSIVLAHCFAARHHQSAPMVQGADTGLGQAAAQGVQDDDAAADLVWDLTSGGVDVVDASIFEGHDYVALGHLHGRQVLEERVRYSGAPIHFSFGESRKPRGVWIVDLDAGGFAQATWRDLPVPRPLSRLRGTITDVERDAAFAGAENNWVEMTLTDPVRPVDAMRRVRQRFPYCVHVLFEPEGAPAAAPSSYTAQVKSRTDSEIVDAFLQHVRDGIGMNAEERALLNDVLATVRSGAEQ